MQKGKMYKHKNCVDMCIYVQEVLYQKPNGDYQFRVMYCDERGFLFHSEMETVSIAEKDLKDWKEIKSA